jgi:hypothetical protein
MRITLHGVILMATRARLAEMSIRMSTFGELR